mgnify:CR=1 FL=1
MSATIDIGTNYTTTGSPGGIGSGGAGAGFELANGGTVYDTLPRYLHGGTHAMVGELGPEMVWLPRGAQVTNAAATRSRAGARGDSFHFNAPLTVVAANPNRFGQAIREAAVEGARV